MQKDGVTGSVAGAIGNVAEFIADAYAVSFYADVIMLLLRIVGYGVCVVARFIFNSLT